MRRQISEPFGIYSITFTCARWLHLFSLTNGYYAVYNWFNYLKIQGHYIVGYVIMPNHVHAVIGFMNTGKSINTIVGNGKRFMAYELVSQLEQRNSYSILVQLQKLVNDTDKSHNKKHEVFEPSFDHKECISVNFIEQKLQYIHMNPCRWNPALAIQPEDYMHSSAKYYITGEQGVYEVYNYMLLQDVDLTRQR
ncbi:hypothetical protein [Terrimonas sp.]|uniref:hypothetical protein n=1 Tax=Terrimonas sp. TaxID=1914338 RepID=UPI001057369A|nr:hypothetical protein [Terrimonas sp.]